MVGEGGAAGASGSGSQKKSKQKKTVLHEDAIVFTRPEDEVFYKVTLSELYVPVTHRL